MSTLRVSNIEAKADASSPTIDEKVKITNSQGRVLMHVDGKTSGITTVGINTTGNTFTVSGNNVTFSGSVTSSGVSTFSSGIVVAAGSTAAPSISPSGDSNTGIFFPAPDTVAIGEGGIEALRVDSSGNIGIGTTNSIVNTQASKIHLYSENDTRGLRITNTLSSSYSEIQFAPTGREYRIGVGGSTASASGTTNSFYIYDNNVSSTRFSVDSGGRVTIPSQPSCSVYLSTNQNITSGTWTQVTLNTTRFNTGNNFNTSTNTFTAPVAGKYFISYSVNFASDTSLVSSGSYLYSSIKINGSFYHYGQGFRNSVIWKSDCTLSAAQLVNLAANDAVTFWAYSDGANILSSGSERTHLAVHLLG